MEDEGIDVLEAEVDFLDQLCRLNLRRTTGSDGLGVFVSCTDAEDEEITLALSDLELAALGHVLPQTLQLSESAWLKLLHRLSKVRTLDGSILVFCPEEGSLSGQTGLSSPHKQNNQSPLQRLDNSPFRNSSPAAERYDAKAKELEARLEAAEQALSESKAKQSQLQREVASCPCHYYISPRYCQVWKGKTENATLTGKLTEMRQELSDKDNELAEKDQEITEERAAKAG